MLSKKVIERISLMKPFYMKGQLKNLYSWKEFENLLNFRPFITERVFRFSGPKKQLKWAAGGWLSEWNSIPPNILKAEINNCVCGIVDCSRVNKKINTVAKQLEEITKRPVDAHIFFSLSEKEEETKGFSRHNDLSHNLITCVEGKFNIKVFDKEKITINKLMQKGDILFVPAGIDHQVTPLTKRLSISFPAATNFDFFQEREWINL